MAARVLALVVVLSALACAGPDANPDKNPETKPAEPGVQAEPSPTRSIVGTWQLIAEEAADDGGGIFGQERRLLELREEGTFHVQNYIEAREGEWTLAGDELILGELYTRVEVLEDARLVLIEDLPKAYLSDGPPRKVRNTYRRVSESELGPMLGAKVELSNPKPGVYAGAYAYSMNKYPTMEIHITQSVVGRARIELKTDGTMTGCFGIATGGSFSESEYSSHDGKHHSRSDDDRRLYAVSGEWTRAQGGARVIASKFWLGTCARVGEAEVMAPIELDCVTIASNERLPVDALACRLVASHSLLEEIAINPADTERSGPYTMQLEPMGHISPDTGRPWLILGAEPGLHIKSKDGRAAKHPEIQFTSEAVDFVEAQFVPPAP